jgi:6,7-dimethyl-8-ribityllumazine synthase
VTADAPSPGGGRAFAVIAASFNEMIVRPLVEGATAAFDAAGVPADRVHVAWVPGAFELPLAARTAATSARYAAIVCLGAVVRGETAHFEYVAGEAARGILDVGLQTGVPVLFGVLTTDTLDQAMDRAGGAHGNKGWDSARAALEMVRVLDDLRAGTAVSPRGVAG